MSRVVLETNEYHLCIEEERQSVLIPVHLDNLLKSCAARFVCFDVHFMTGGPCRFAAVEEKI